MDSSLLFQYILVAAIVLFAAFSLIKILKKNFAPKKFSSKRSNCDQDCGCS